MINKMMESSSIVPFLYRPPQRTTATIYNMAAAKNVEICAGGEKIDLDGEFDWHRSEAVKKRKIIQSIGRWG